MNPDPVDVDTTLAALSLAEKAALLSGADAWRTTALDRPGAHIPPIEVGDGPHGLRKETGVDMVWYPATAFPTASALGASWDRELVRRVGRAMGAEARTLGVQVLLGPGVNMKRSPLCGRNFEYFAEDPLLTGELAVAYVDGVQSMGIGTSLKHFAANNQEIERTRVSVEVDDRALREIYLAAFEQVVTTARPWTVMCSYNRLRGVHASENRWLLTEVLREEWGYEGLVISDWDAVHDRVRALAAGLDLQMPGTGGDTDAEVVAAVRQGRLNEAAVDTAARRVLELAARGSAALGAPTAQRDPAIPPDLAEQHHALAREAAAGAITLLRNTPSASRGAAVLPLNPDSAARIAVIGAFAAHPRIQGGGSSGVCPTRVDDALGAIRALAGDRVDFAPGFVHTPLNPYQDDVRALLAAHQGNQVVPWQDAARASLTEQLRLAAQAERMLAGLPSSAAQHLADEAVAMAQHAEVILAFVGLPLAFEQEANDRTTLALPGDQVALLSRLADLRERTGAALVIVLSNGSAVTMDPWHDRVDAIVETWLPGQAGAGAVADVLFGAVNPSGKVAETFPLALSDTPGQPSWDGERGSVHYGEGVFIGYRWYDTLRREVRYPFGHGLSYTTFEYAGLTVDAVDPDSGQVRVSCTITNSGDRAGRDVVQLYVGDPVALVHRPVRELRGFVKVDLKPGASERVGFELSSRDFAFWDVATDSAAGRRGTWRREGGEFVIEIGASSRDIRLRTSIELSDDPTLGPAVPDAELG